MYVNFSRPRRGYLERTIFSFVVICLAVHSIGYGKTDKDGSITAFPPHTIISMPALSPTMSAGNIGAWQKKAGDALQPGDVLVEIETDKAQMDFEFQDEGVLAKVLKDTGEKEVPVGSVCLYSRRLLCA